MTLAEAIEKGMTEDGVTSIGWGDNALVNYVAHLTKRNHPLNKMSAAMQAMENSNRFVKFYRKSMDMRGNERTVRCFKLKGDQS